VLVGRAADPESAPILRIMLQRRLETERSAWLPIVSRVAQAQPQFASLIQQAAPAAP